MKANDECDAEQILKYNEAHPLSTVGETNCICRAEIPAHLVTLATCLHIMNRGVLFLSPASHDKQNDSLVSASLFLFKLYSPLRTPPKENTTSGPLTRTCTSTSG